MWLFWLMGCANFALATSIVEIQGNAQSNVLESSHLEWPLFQTAQGSTASYPPLSTMKLANAKVAQYSIESQSPQSWEIWHVEINQNFPLISESAWKRWFTASISWKVSWTLHHSWVWTGVVCITCDPQPAVMQNRQDVCKQHWTRCSYSLRCLDELCPR